MGVKFNVKLLAALNEGRIIVYEQRSGGLILLDADKRYYKDREAQPTMAEFLELCKQGQIELYSTMDQGHHIFFGRVGFYRKTDRDPLLVTE